MALSVLLHGACIGSGGWAGGTKHGGRRLRTILSVKSRNSPAAPYLPTCAATSACCTARVCATARSVKSIAGSVVGVYLRLQMAEIASMLQTLH